jgi:hypothetical protein
VHTVDYVVAVSGTTAVMGTSGDYPYGVGRAWVFTKTEAGWKQAARLKGSDSVAGDGFGSSMARGAVMSSASRAH